MLEQYKNSKYPFEDYLQHVHSLGYTGLDDDMPDDFNDWLGNLDGEDYITHGNAFAKMLLDSIK